MYVLYIATICPKCNIVSISQQSVVPSVSLVKEIVQLLTRVPVLMRLKVHYAMEVSKHKHIVFMKKKPKLVPISYDMNNICIFV